MEGGHLLETSVVRDASGCVTTDLTGFFDKVMVPIMVSVSGPTQTLTPTVILATDPNPDSNPDLSPSVPPASTATLSRCATLTRR